MNSWSAIGRLTRDPEERYTQAGDAVASFTLAVDRAGDKQDDGSIAAGFFDCVAFGKTAELILQHFHKGKQIGVTGALQHHRWVNNDGDKRSKVQARIFDVTFTGKKGDDDYDFSDGDDQFRDAPPADDDDFAAAPASTAAAEPQDDIPF